MAKHKAFYHHSLRAPKVKDPRQPFKPFEWQKPRTVRDIGGVGSNHIIEGDSATGSHRSKWVGPLFVGASDNCNMALHNTEGVVPEPEWYEDDGTGQPVKG